MSLSVIKRCAVCGELMYDDDFMQGDDPDLCELCNEVTHRDS